MNFRRSAAAATIDTPDAADCALAAMGGAVHARPTGPTLATYHGSITSLHGAVWFLGDCACAFCDRALAVDPDDDRAVIVTPDAVPITHVRWVSVTFPGACATCGSKDTTIAEVLNTKPLGSFSLAGVQMKVSATASTAVVCAGCAAPA